MSASLKRGYSFFLIMCLSLSFDLKSSNPNITICQQDNFHLNLVSNTQPYTINSKAPAWKKNTRNIINIMIIVQLSHSLTRSTHRISRAPQSVLIVLSRWRMDKEARDPTKPLKGTHMEDCTDSSPTFVDSSLQCLLLKPGPIVNHLLCLYIVFCLYGWFTKIKPIIDGKNTTNKIWQCAKSKNLWTGLFQYFSFLNFHGCCDACTRQGLGFSNLD